MIRSPHRPAVRAFSLIELLTVVLIIGLLAGLLLPALRYGQIRAQSAAKRAQLQSIANAAESYNMTFSGYPGYFEDYRLIDDVPLTANQNMVISLLGRMVPTGQADDRIALDPSGDMEFDRDAVGLGPRSRAGQQHDAFYSPSPDELANADALEAAGYERPTYDVPMLVDPISGAPIFYSRVDPNGQTPADPRPGVGKINYRDYLMWDPDYFGEPSLFADSRRNIAGAVIDPELSPAIQEAMANDPPRDPDLLDGGNVISGAFVLIAPNHDGVFFEHRRLGDDPGFFRYQPTEGEPDGRPLNAQIEDFQDVVIVGGSR